MVYQGYVEVVQHFLKGIQLFQGMGAVRVQMLISYNYITFYFPGEGLPLFPNPI